MAQSAQRFILYRCKIVQNTILSPELSPRKSNFCDKPYQVTQSYLAMISTHFNVSQTVRQSAHKTQHLPNRF